MKLSILMTYYDGGYRLPLMCKTLATLADQGMGVVPEWEVVVVEDGPNDTLGLLDELREHIGTAYQHHRLKRDGYNNPARAMNIGIREAKGDILMIQNPEVFHVGSIIRACLGTLDKLGDRHFVFPTCWSLTPDGLIDPQTPQYCGVTNPRPFFFCGAIHRKHLIDIGGVDEDYNLPTWDDNDLAVRLQHGLGLNPYYITQAHVYHQWHPRPDNLAWCDREMRALYDRKMKAWERGEIDHVRNQGRAWGKL